MIPSGKFSLTVVTIILLFTLPSCRYMRMPDEKARQKFEQHDMYVHLMHTSVDGINLHYVKVGSDTLPTLFFIHGSPGSWKAYERYLMDTILIKHFRMIAIDRPGFGYSNRGHAYHLPKQSELIYGIVKKEMNGKPLHIIGHSLGGPIVVKLAQDHPGAYASLTILAGSISPYDEPKERWRTIFIHNPLQYLLPGPFRVCNTEIWYFKKELYAMDTCYNRLSMPVTFIHGDKDNLVPVHNAEYGRQKLAFNKQVKVIIIPGANHHIPSDHFDIVKTHLLTLAESSK